MADPTIIQPDELPDTRERGYSQARVQDGVLYVSGMTGRERETDAAGNWIPAGPDVETQTRQAFENLEHVLDDVDKEFVDVPKVTSYVANTEENMAGHERVFREEVFTEEPYPCWTALAMAPGQTDLLVEVDIVVPL